MGDGVEVLLIMTLFVLQTTVKDTARTERRGRQKVKY